MAVKKTDDGRRSVEAEVEVPGTPEEVWEAIATGGGISSWFVPSTVEEREGGETVSSFGPGMDAVSKITRWDPPRSFSAGPGDVAGEGGPEGLATEWIVEARDGGRCVVRVVHRWFSETDDWDGQFEGHAYGWATSYFLMLRLYLSHFRGQASTVVQLTSMIDLPAPEVWRTLRGALGVSDGSARFASGPDTPELAGVVEPVVVTDPELLRIRESSPQIVAALEGMQGMEPELVLRLQLPAPGLAHLMSMAFGEQTMLSMRFHLYGEAGAVAAAATERDWDAWIAERFPQPASG